MKTLHSSCLGFYLLLTLVGLVKSAIEIQIDVPRPPAIGFPAKGIRILLTHKPGIKQVEFSFSFASKNFMGSFTKIDEPINGRWIYENKMLRVPTGKKFFLKVRITQQQQQRENTEQFNAEPFIGRNGGSSALLVDPKNYKNNRNVKKLRTTVNGLPRNTGQLIFEDHFDYIDWNKWNREVQIPLSKNDADFVSFQRRPENSYIEDGILKIIPSLLSNVTGFNELSILNGTLDFGAVCTGVMNPEEECSKKAEFAQILPPVVSARITTRNKFSFRYGKIEVKAKLPKGDWIFPLIVLEPSEFYYGSSGYASGQLRVVSIRGNEYLVDKSGNDISGRQLNDGVVLATGDICHKNIQQTVGGSHRGDEFHKYTLVWTDESMEFYEDDVRYKKIEGRLSSLIQDPRAYISRWDTGDYMAPFDREFVLTLGVSVGGRSEFPDKCRTGGNEEKPWRNDDPKALYKFWEKRQSWFKTWKGNDTGLQVDYIKIYAI